jgi:hypothetical protein
MLIAAEFRHPTAPWIKCRVCEERMDEDTFYDDAFDDPAIQDASPACSQGPMSLDEVSDDWMKCWFCERWACRECTRQCEGCEHYFCRFCSMIDYSAELERDFCLDCFRNGGVAATKNSAALSSFYSSSAIARQLRISFVTTIQPGNTGDPFQEPMKIFVRIRTGSKLARLRVLHVMPTDTIETVKKTIQKEDQGGEWELDNMALSTVTKSYRTLQDPMSLEDYGIQKESTLLLVKKRGTRAWPPPGLATAGLCISRVTQDLKWLTD